MVNRIVGVGAGHGGADRGAVHGTFIESAFNLMVARELAFALNTSALPVDAQLIRDDAFGMDFTERNKRAEEIEAELILSIHTNAYFSDLLHGTMCFYWPGNKLTRLVGETVMRSAPAPLYRRGSVPLPTNCPMGEDTQWLQKPRTVVGAYSQPCVLIELGYLSNQKDREALLHDETRQALVQAVVCGVAGWIQATAEEPEFEVIS